MFKILSCVMATEVVCIEAAGTQGIERDPSDTRDGRDDQRRVP